MKQDSLRWVCGPGKRGRGRMCGYIYIIWTHLGSASFLLRSGLASAAVQSRWISHLLCILFRLTQEWAQSDFQPPNKGRILLLSFMSCKTSNGITEHSNWPELELSRRAIERYFAVHFRQGDEQKTFYAGGSHLHVSTTSVCPGFLMDLQISKGLGEEDPTSSLVWEEYKLLPHPRMIPRGLYESKFTSSYEGFSKQR